MKKLFLALSLMAAALTVNAQPGPRPEGPRPEGPRPEGPAPMEAGSDLKPESNSLTIEVAFAPFAALNNQVGLENSRLNASYSFSDNLAVRLGLGFDIENEKNDDGDDTEKSSSFSLAPGIVYSFEGTRHFTPYIGAEVIVGHGKYGVENETKATSFGVQAFTGMNYYYSKNLYVGVECGLGVNHTKVKDGDASTSFKPYAQPAVRLGYTF